MKVSIIIPTYKRNEMLCKTLSNIITFEQQYHELIVVDQTKGHEPETRQYLDDLIAHKKIKYVYAEMANLPNARNVGIKEASGDIMLFFDDDIEINENTIPSHISGFSQDDIGCVTGKVRIQNIEQTENKALKKSGPFKKFLKKFLMLFWPTRASHVGRLGILSDFTRNKTLPSDSCIGCNMSFRAEVFPQCGFFDVNYSGNAIREDTDMSIRLRHGGYRIMYVPNASVIHYMDNTGGTRTDPNEAYWHIIFRNQCYFYLKNFRYSRRHIRFIQLFDIISCRKSGLNADAIFKQSYEETALLFKRE
jgi:GT2 family glycosyltransferase